MGLLINIKSAARFGAHTAPTTHAASQSGNTIDFGAAESATDRSATTADSDEGFLSKP
jgi:hypothetical protein